MTTKPKPKFEGGSGPGFTHTQKKETVPFANPDLLSMNIFIYLDPDLLSMNIFIYLDNYLGQYNF